MGLKNVCRKREGECGVMFIEVLCVAITTEIFLGLFWFCVCKNQLKELMYSFALFASNEPLDFGLNGCV